MSRVRPPAVVRRSRLHRARDDVAQALRTAGSPATAFLYPRMKPPSRLADFRSPSSTWRSRSISPMAISSSLATDSSSATSPAACIAGSTRQGHTARWIVPQCVCGQHRERVLQPGSHRVQHRHLAPASSRERGAGEHRLSRHHLPLGGRAGVGGCVPGEEDPYLAESGGHVSAPRTHHLWPARPLLLVLPLLVEPGRPSHGSQRCGLRPAAAGRMGAWTGGSLRSWLRPER